MKVRDSLAAWTLGRPGRLGLLVGSGFGLFMGIFYAMTKHQVVWVLVGIPEGLFFGLAMRAVYRRRGIGPAGLSVDDGRRALVAVRRGDPIDDPALAPAVVRLADDISRPGPVDGRLVFGGLYLLSLAMVIIDLAVDNVGGATWFALSMVLWMAAFFWFPRRRRLQVERAGRAREHASRLLES